MPTISMFYGILIRMFFKDIERHNTAHVHAEYQGSVGTYSIPQGVACRWAAAQQAQAGGGVD